MRYLNPWATGLLKLLFWVCVAYAGLCLAAFLAQRRLMYFPDHSPEQESLLRASRLGLGPWRDGAGRLLGWRRPLASPLRPRVLLLHGNAGDALGRVDYMVMLETAGFEGVLLEYPGYGCRVGEPSQPALVGDARAALFLLYKEGAPVFLLGESLGSGVAVQVVNQRLPNCVGGTRRAPPSTGGGPMPIFVTSRSFPISKPPPPFTNGFPLCIPSRWPISLPIKNRLFPKVSS